MQATHAHRFAGPAQQQRVTHLHMSGQCRAGHHNTCASNAECAVDGQAKTSCTAAPLNVTLRAQERLTQCFDTATRHTRHHELSCARIRPWRQQGAHLALHLLHPGRLDAVTLADDHQRPGDTQQLDNRQMLTGLRHHPVVGRYDQQHKVNAVRPGEHVVDKPLMPRYINKTGLFGPRPQRRIAIPQVDGDTAFALLPATIACLPGQCFQQRSLAMIDMPGRSDNHLAIAPGRSCGNCSSQPASSSNWRRSIHSASSSMRPSTGIGKARKAASSASK